MNDIIYLTRILHKPFFHPDGIYIARREEPINLLGIHPQFRYTESPMHATPSNNDNNGLSKEAPTRRSVFWITLVWVVLIIKSAILSTAICHFDIDIGHIWIWGPSLFAATLISFLIWQKP